MQRGSGREREASYRRFDRAGVASSCGRDIGSGGIWIRWILHPRRSVVNSTSNSVAPECLLLLRIPQLGAPASTLVGIARMRLIRLTLHHLPSILPLACGGTDGGSPGCVNKRSRMLSIVSEGSVREFSSPVYVTESKRQLSLRHQWH